MRPEHKGLTGFGSPYNRKVDSKCPVRKFERFLIVFMLGKSFFSNDLTIKEDEE